MWQTVTTSNMGEQQQLGRYELGAEIGRGATGVVYKARDPIIDRVVALKTVDFRSFGANQAVEQGRFFQEAKSAGRLSHPNIVTIYDAGEAQGCAYIAMELLEGASLREMLDGRPPIAVGRALEITAQIARGLAYAHEHGVVHRDVKPANVILVGSRRAKITDFGIARFNTASQTAQKELAGSPKYMSPEQIRGEEVDGRSDLFSLGTMLYEMVTGRPPFDGPNLPAIMKSVVEQAPQQPSSVHAEVPREVDKLIARLLAKSPDDRYPSARALLRDLSSLLKKYNTKGSSDTRDETLQRAKRIKEARRRRVSDGETTIVMGVIGGNEPPPKRKERKLPVAAFYGMGAAGLALLVVIGLYMRESEPLAAAIPAIETAPPQVIEVADTPPPAVTEEPAALPLAETQVAVEQPPVPPEPVAVDTAIAPVAVPPPAPTKPSAVRAPRKTAAATPAPSTSPAAPVETGTVILAVSPWGEVLVDGESRGTAPPISSLALPVGRHRIEIRNGNLPAYAVEMNVGAGETRRIKHKFE